MFVLPKCVLKQITQTLKNFLWKGNESNSKGAKVAWSKVSRAKREGGLGFRDLVEWNKALNFKLIWRFISEGHKCFGWIGFMGIQTPCRMCLILEETPQAEREDSFSAKTRKYKMELKLLSGMIIGTLGTNPRYPKGEGCV